jgi:trans-AT polyketide synthase/acyltransferase/oxidoreductase domain-containing protein
MGQKIAYLFSGQGSHYYGMGKNLFDTHPVFRESMRGLDSMFQDMGSPSVLAELYRDDRSAADRFDALRFTHPAIFMLQFALYETLLSEGLEPDCVLGYSLGECAAAAAAGVLSVEELALCILENVKVIEQFCPQGGMLAVLADASLFHAEPTLHAKAELAAVNSEQHFVIAASREEISTIGRFLRRAGVISQKLSVNYAFHSSAMDTAAQPYIRYLSKFKARESRIPWISCVNGDTVTSFDPTHLWRVVRSPIRFRDAVAKLERSSDGCLYVDLGPSGTLANFAKQNRLPGSRSETTSVLNPFAAGSSGHERIQQFARVYEQSRTERVKRSEKMKAYLFPGQGSQIRGMGGELFDEFPQETALADRVLGYSIARLCREDPERQLDKTQFTQPALFVVNALSYLRKVRNGKNGVAYSAGHSLGEYNALFAAGAFDFETGLRMVQKRAALMARATEGGMAAVIGLDEATVCSVLANKGLRDIDIANYNGAAQFIVSGPRQAVLNAAPLFTAAGAQNYIPLRVGGAFHSRYMEPARKEFEEFLSQFTFNKLAMSVIANVTGQPHEEGMIARMLVEQLTKPVRWDRTIDFLLSREVEFEELGHGNVLTRLTEKIRQSAAASAPRVGAAASANGNSLRAVSGSVQPSSDVLVASLAPNEPSMARSHAVPPLNGNYRDHTAGPAVREKPAATPLPPIDDAADINIRRIPATLVPSEHAFNGGAARLGSSEFRKAYGARYAYACGAMYRGIASEQLVVRAARAGILAFFGTGGLELPQIERAIRSLQEQLREGEPYGMNLVHNPSMRSLEEGTVELFLSHGIRNIEASAFMQVAPALVWYRIKGLARTLHGATHIPNRIIAKVSRPEVAEAFLAPPSEAIVRQLQEQGRISAEVAQLASQVPMADDLCIEADSGGHTDQGNLMVLLPSMLRLRDQAMEKYRYRAAIRVGAAGGIGTPEAAAGAFLLGADFIVTGSINLCTVEAGISPAVKDMLEQMNVQDTEHVPAGDMFEMGAKVQVLKRGVFFPARAKKLYELYRRHDSLEQIDPATRLQIEERYFQKSFEDVYRETREYFLRKDPTEIEKAEENPKHKMALVFRWYFGRSLRLAMEGESANRVDFQVHCGPALGAFNQWVKGTPLESWKNRHVDEIGKKLMTATAEYLDQQITKIAGPAQTCA